MFSSNSFDTKEFSEKHRRYNLGSVGTNFDMAVENCYRLLWNGQKNFMSVSVTCFRSNAAITNTNSWLTGHLLCHFAEVLFNNVSVIRRKLLFDFEQYFFPILWRQVSPVVAGGEIPAICIARCF